MSGLFKRRRKIPAEADPASAALQTEKEQFLVGFILVLLRFLKDFSLDAKELEPERFREVIDTLARKLLKERTVKGLRTFFEKQKGGMGLFIKKQKRFLDDKETEFKETIDLLTQAMADLNTDNYEFTQKMLEQSKKVEQVTTLSDIKEMKQVLKSVIEDVRDTVSEKQSRDDKQIKMLSKKVRTLHNALEKAEEGTLRDGLTGVYNMTALERYLKKGARGSGHSAFSMLALDIDDFAKIVEVYGPKLGDRVTLAIAEKCREFVGPSDFLARYKGGAFVMVLPSESLKHAAKRAKRLCKTVAASKYTLDDVKAEHVLSFTISVGAARFKRHDTVATVTRRTLEALHTAKRSGGNRVVSKKGRGLRTSGDDVIDVDPE